MRNLRGTYVHRGDAARRRRRLKRFLYASAAAAVVAIVLATRHPGTANAEVALHSSSFSLGLGGGTRELREALDSTKGEMDLLRAQYERADKIIHYSSRFAIPANMAMHILDESTAEGIDPELAFRLVRLESGFNPHATSSVGAIGLTQMMLPTARYYDGGITKDKLYDPTTNLRIGFRYLRGLISQYHGDAKLALLVYNRGEVAVNNALRAGLDPSNGYDRIITRGYKGKGVVE
ncbi:MAG TPA: lytic transglycosylase domain-containing protein [Gemmatimonadaceae bacterium]|nr:lytic transglycosylase domain-containing protein [Gemmatimonadaceae bacterium]